MTKQIKVGSEWVRYEGGQAKNRIKIVSEPDPMRYEVEAIGGANAGSKRTVLRTSIVHNYKPVENPGEVAQAPEPAPASGVAAKPVKAALTSAESAELKKLKSLIEKHRVPGSDITTIDVELTPILAKVLVQTMDVNRRASPKTVETYTRDVSADNWQYSHQGMALGPKLQLGDGQHRCLAVIKAEKSITVQLSVYHTQSAYEKARNSWDSGNKRSKGHFLEIGGYVAPGQGKRVAAILESITHVDGTTVLHPTKEEMLLQYIEMNDHVNAVIKKLSAKEFDAPLSAAFVIAHRKAPKETEQLMDFVVSKVGYAADSAAHAFVKWLPLRSRDKHDRAQTTLDAMSLMYKHVKGQRGVGVVRNNKEAQLFFLGGEARQSSGR